MINPVKSADSSETGHRPGNAAATLPGRMIRWMIEGSMGKGFALCATALMVGLVLALTEIILNYRINEVASEKSAAALAFASELRARTDRELNSVLFLSSGIVGYLVVRHRQINPVEIDSILGEIFRSGRHLRNITFAIGYRIANVHPRAGNERVLGVDYRDIPGQWPSVQQAIETRKVILNGPVKLIQGGEGLIFRSPIFINDAYWGILSTVIDIPSLQRSAFADLDSRRFEFAIRIDEETGTGGGLFYGREALFSSHDAVILEAPMPNGKWAFAVRVADQRNNTLLWMIRALGWLLAVVAGLSVLGVLRHRRELSFQAGFDSLTNLPNRRLFDDRLEQAILRHSRKGGTRIAVIFLDLDGFKSINDKHGHKSGDLVLRTVAARIREEVRVEDTVSRWAGDEFVLIIEETSPLYVSGLVERLQRHAEQPFDVIDSASIIRDGRVHYARRSQPTRASRPFLFALFTDKSGRINNGAELKIRISIGTAYYPDEAHSSVELLDLADRRMYGDKSGKNSPDKITDPR